MVKSLRIKTTDPNKANGTTTKRELKPQRINMIKLV